MSIDLHHYKAGVHENGYKYQYFVPNKINDQWSWNQPQLNLLLEKAAIKLGELNSYARLVPNIDLFIQLHVTKEAVVSSRIEGTRTKIDEALLPEMEISPERRDDWREVNNYVTALNQAIANLDELPISSRLLKQAHKTLLSGVRGETKLPGEFRTSQNWIGASLADATFVPPSHQYVENLMGDLENFLHNDHIQLPALIKIAIAHYQFETIHPFLDGNGRIGRLMITLFLVSEKILDRPLLYLSGFFEKNKGLYYDNLTRVRTHDDMLQWLKYFLVGIEKTASEAVQTLSNILQMKSKLESHIQQHFGRRSANAVALLQYLFKLPIISVEDVKAVCNVSYKSANDLVSAFCEHGILTEITGQSRNRLFAFHDYLSIFESSGE